MSHMAAQGIQVVRPVVAPEVVSERGSGYRPSIGRDQDREQHH